MDNQLSEISSTITAALSLVAVMVTFFIVVKMAKWVLRGDSGGDKYTGWDYDSRTSGFEGDKWVDVERYYRDGKPTGRIRKHYRNRL